MAFRIRRATLRDLPALRAQRDAMFRDMGFADERALRAADRAYARWARPRLRAGTLAGFLAVAPSGRVAAGGCVWLRPQQPGPRRPERLPYLFSMHTLPEFRGRGLATRIVRAATAWARARGFPKMILHASRMGRGVYAKLGWTRTWEMETPL